MLAIDISMYQGHPGPDWWQQLRSDGWELAIVGSWHGLSPNQHAEQNLKEAKAAGLRTATYIALNSGAGRESVRKGKRACGSAWADLAFVAIDCETDGITKTIISEAEAEVRNENLRPIIYTAGWWWRDRFGDPDDFKHLPLWNADYDQVPARDFPSPYGGWALSDLKGKQYDGSTRQRHPMLFGVEVDKNNFDGDWVLERAGSGVPTTSAQPGSDLSTLQRDLNALREEMRLGDRGIHEFLAVALTDLDSRIKALEN